MNPVSRPAALMLGVSLLLTAGCATMSVTPGADSLADDTASGNQWAATDHRLPPSADRQAILAMAGEFSVDFSFDETVALVPDYRRSEPKRSGADEVVIVIEDSGNHIVLQHLLVVGDGSVIKHWRQDWTWQADHRLEFTDDQTWVRVELDDELTRRAWTQCVYGVADTPRYCGTGPWNHRYGHATWTSDRSWRPLPRREYTTRNDYNALNVENRHTITPYGWTHEQDNSKVVRENGKTRAVIVREFGFNDYRHQDEVDFTPAYEYWDRTADYWARVRAVWREHFEAGGVHLATGIDGMPIIEGLFELAENHKPGQPVADQAIRSVFSEYVRPESAALAGN